MSEERSTRNNRILHHGDEAESSCRQCKRKQPAENCTGSNPLVIDGGEPGSSSLRHHPSTCQYSGQENQIGPAEAEVEAKAEAEADANENENNAATLNAPLLAQQILDEVIIREDEIMPLENLPELALHGAEQFLGELIAAFTQGRIDLNRFINAILLLRASVIMQGMMEFPEPNMEVRTGLTQEEIEARMQPCVYRVSKNVLAEDVDTCCICLDDFAMNEPLGKLDCGHEFHYNCIQPWLSQKNECPICKKTALA